MTGAGPAFNHDFGDHVGGLGRPKRAPIGRRAFTQAMRTLREELGRMEEAPGRVWTQLPHDPGSEIARAVAKRMIASFGRRLADAQQRVDRRRLDAGPLVQAAVKRKLMTQRELAALFGVSDASISALKSLGKASGKIELQLEQALREAAAAWSAARRERDVLQAHRRRWLTLADQIGVPAAELREASGLSPQGVKDALRHDPARVKREQALLVAPDVATLIGGDPAGEAERFATRAVIGHLAETHGDDVAILHAIAWFLLRDGDEREGVALYERAAALGSACAAHNLGERARIAGDLDEAERWLREADRLRHACPRARALGDLLAERGRHADAREAWRAAAERGVSSAARALAESLHAIGEHTREWHWVEHAAQLGDGAALRRIGWWHWNAGRHEEARAAYVRAAEAGDAEAACWIGRELAREGDRSAQRFLEQASEAGHRGATAELISLLAGSRPLRALAACHRLREQGGEPPPALYAELLCAHDGSKEALQQARELWLGLGREGDATALLQAGAVARRLGDAEAAEDDLWEALEHGDSMVAASAAWELAELRRRPGTSFEAALHDVVEEAFDLGIHGAASAFADLYESLEDHDAAIAVIRRARRLAKDPLLQANLEADQLWLVLHGDLGTLDQEVVEEAVRRWKRCAARGSIAALAYVGARYAVLPEEQRAAERVFAQLVEAGVPYHRELAEALAAQGRIEEATQTLECGISEGEVDCFAPRGQLASDSGDAEDAEAWWRRGASEHDWESSCLLGLELDRRGETDAAKEVLARAAERSSSCAMNLLGTIEYRTSRSKGIHWFRRAWKATCFHGAFNLAAALAHSSASGSLLERRQALEFVLSGTPDDLDAALMLAEVTAGDPQPAILPIVYQSAWSDPRAAEVVRLLDPDGRLDAAPPATGRTHRLRVLARSVRQRRSLSGRLD